MQGIAQKILANPAKYSIEQLTQGVQNGVIPAYVGIPLIQEKIKEQKEAQVMPMGQQQQRPVAEQIMQEAQSAGVPALSSNLPQEYAGGGIIAFDEGGEVKRYSGVGPSLTSSVPNDPQAVADREAMLDTLERIKAAGMDIATLPGRGLLGAAETVITRPLRAIGVPFPYLPDSVYGGNRASTTPYYDRLRAQETPAVAAAPASETKKPETPPEVKREDKADTGGGIKQLLSSLGIAGARGAGLGIGGSRAPGLGLKAPEPFVAPRGKSMTALTQELVGGGEGADGLLEKAEARDKATEAAIAAEKAKVTGKAFEDYKKSLEAEAKDFGAGKEEAKNMALLKAGLAMMAGTSQHGLENIGKGALVGAEDYQAAMKDIKKAQRENRKELSLIEQARRAEELGDRDKAIDRLTKSNEVKELRDRYVGDFIFKAYGIDRAQAYDLAKTNYTTQADIYRQTLQGEYGLEGSRISAGANLAAQDLGGRYGIAAALLRNREPIMSPYQMARLRADAEKRVDPDAVRADLAKQLKMSKVPAAGADASFDDRFRMAYDNEVNRTINRFLGAPGGGGVGGSQNPYEGYRLVPPN
jgi:tetratricopeptide (TPR) repeat protein